MGEATYYMKLHFGSSEEAAAALPKVAAFIDEGRKAYDYWQGHCGKEPFWPEFQAKFPEITNYLMYIKVFGDDSNNTPFGLLDFGTDETPFDDGSDVAFAAYVWHFAAWDPWLTYLMHRLEAENFNWLSDEYVELWPLLDRRV